MIQEPSIALDSPFARIDLRLKIVFIVLFSFAVALAENWETLFFSLAVSVVIVSLTRLTISQVIKPLFLAFGFILFLWAILPFTVTGTALYQIGPLDLTREGLFLAALISLKSATILLAFLALSTSSSIAAMGHALQNLGVPEKLVYLFLFCYRYIFVIEQEFRRLEKAARLRSFQPGTNIHTYRTYAYLVGMLFLRSSLRAEQVHKAMVCRGFHGRFFSLEKMAFRRQDGWWAGAFFLAFFMVLVIEWNKNLF
ncbi:MAG: cobalt ECF transporter T component CbiQ [Deltaproteobacteria bacterium]|nr:cobalt ECF transporter T component CbiQ [Deltaproteobacteria bacterium]